MRPDMVSDQPNSAAAFSTAMLMHMRQMLQRRRQHAVGNAIEKMEGPSLSSLRLLVEASAAEERGG